MLLPNGCVACVRLRALDVFLCPDIFSDALVARRSAQVLLAILQDEYASAAADAAAAKAVMDACVSPACACGDSITRQAASCCKPLLYQITRT